MLEEPKDFNIWIEFKREYIYLSNSIWTDCEQYQQAKDKVIFEGFELTVNVHGVWWVESKSHAVKSDCKYTIQDLIKYAPTLTNYGKQISGYEGI